MRRGPGSTERQDTAPRASLSVLDELGELGIRRSTPAAPRSPPASSASMRRSPGPISRASPRARRAAAGIGGSPRTDRASCETGRHVPAECGDGIEALGVVEQVHVVQDQDDLLVARRQSPSQTRGTIVASTDTPVEASASKTAVERRDPVERSRDVGQQNDWIVVLLITDTHAKERSPRPGGPLGEQRRLPHPGPADRKTIGIDPERSSRNRSGLRATRSRHEPAADSASTREARTPALAHEPWADRRRLRRRHPQRSLSATEGRPVGQHEDTEAYCSARRPCSSAEMDSCHLGDDPGAGARFDQMWSRTSG